MNLISVRSRGIKPINAEKVVLYHYFNLYFSINQCYKVLMILMREGNGHLQNEFIFITII